MGLFVIAYGRCCWPGRKWTNDMGGLTRRVDYTGHRTDRTGRWAEGPGRTSGRIQSGLAWMSSGVLSIHFANIAEHKHLQRKKKSYKINHMVVRFFLCTLYVRRNTCHTNTCSTYVRETLSYFKFNHFVFDFWNANISQRFIIRDLDKSNHLLIIRPSGTINNRFVFHPIAVLYSLSLCFWFIDFVSSFECKVYRTMWTLLDMVLSANLRYLSSTHCVT